MSKTGRRSPQPATPAPTQYTVERITVGEFLTASPLLGRIFVEARPLDVKLTYRLAGLAQALAVHDTPEAPHHVAIHAARQRAFEKLGARGDDGNYVIDEKDETAKAAFAGMVNEAIAAIADEPLAVSVRKLTLDELGQLQLQTQLSVAEMNAIRWLIQDE